MSERNAVVSSRTDWSAISAAAKALVEMIAASPVWGITDFQEPPADLLDEMLAAAWNRAGFTEERR